MASREHQGLQISLIIFVMIGVGLGAFAGVFYNKYDKTVAKIDSYKDDAKKNESKALAAEKRLDAMKRFLGFQPETPLEEIQTAWEGDMARFNSLLPQVEGDLDYRQVVTALATEVRKQDIEVARHATEIATHDVKIASLQAAHKGDITRYMAASQKAIRDLAGERLVFGTQRQQTLDASTKIARNADAMQRNFRETERVHKIQMTAMNTEREKFRGLAEGRARQNRRLTQPSFEKADAKVTWVNQKANLVYISVGREDNLNPQVTFSVYGRGVNNVTEQKPKGSIEVTRIIDRHLAEARIISDSLTNVIVPGDVVFSPSWTAGQKRHFAFAGLIDFNDDGKSDMRRVRDLMHTNGSVIDAVADESGLRTGKVSIDTRYLVTGKPPTNKEGLDNYSRLIGECQDFSIEQISTDKFREMIGWRSSSRTVTLGSGARSDDFKPRSSDSNTFKPRRP